MRVKLQNTKEKNKQILKDYGKTGDLQRTQMNWKCSFKTKNESEMTVECSQGAKGKIAVALWWYH